MVEPNHHPNRAQSRPRPASRGKLAFPALSATIYRGCRERDGTSKVWVEETPVSVAGDTTIGSSSERPLPLHLEIRSHSPTGFEWGYGGSGPAQLALALLADALGDQELAQWHHQDFKRAAVAGWGPSWSITAEEIRRFVARNSLI